MQREFLIDISRLLARAAQRRLPTGVDRVCLAYVQRWASRAQAVVQKGGFRRMLRPAHSQALFELLLDPPSDFTRRMHTQFARAWIPPWPAQDARGKPGFYLGHQGLDAGGFSAWIKQTRQQAVYFLHDLIPITHAEYCRTGEQTVHAQRLSVMLQAGSGLITNSQDTLDALGEWAGRHGLTMPPSVVAPLAPAPLLAPGLVARPLDKKYFVVLGTVEPRKNHLLLLNAWREMAQTMGDACPHLVLIGQRGWECENVVDMLERCAALHGRVHEISDCPDAQLAAYLAHAQALLFPSFAEGFGMPLVEALMQGTPVIASSLPVFREIAGDIPDYLDPTDGPAWMQAVRDYCCEPSARRDAQMQRMPGFSVPTWDAHFAQVEQLLEKLA